MVRLPRAFGSALCALDFISEPALELVLTGDPKADDYRALQAELGARYLPNRIEARLHTDAASSLPLLAGKTRGAGKAALYVCQNFACSAPITEPSEVAGLLGERAERAT
jgi:uncharacterized protein YyaL (SSP411 family)